MNPSSLGPFSAARVLRRKPERIRKFYIPRKLLQETQQILTAAAPGEGYLVWVGRLTNQDEARIEVAFPFSGPASSEGAEASDADLVALREHLRLTASFVFAQVHSHPGSAFHSPTDNVFAFSMKRGFLSIVAPDYGNVDFSDLSPCAVYERAGGWRRLDSADIADRIVILATEEGE